MGLISRVSSRTYRELPESHTMFARGALRFTLQRAAKPALQPSRTLATTFARQAGYTTYRTTMPEALARATKDHTDVQAIMVFQIVGTLLLIGIFTHGAKDPRQGHQRPRHVRLDASRPIHRPQTRLAEGSLRPAYRYLHRQPKGLRVA